MKIRAQIIPVLAGATGLLLALLLIGSRSLSGGTALPLLTVLFICEFGFFVTAAGGGYGISIFKKQGGIALLSSSLCCLLLAIFFIFSGLQIWQGMS